MKKKKKKKRKQQHTLFLCSLQYSFLQLFYFLKIELQLIYNIVLVSGV